jgi:signal transduction histidine kinase
MPGMDGFETARLIHEREKTRDLPIIFLTAIYKSETHVLQGYAVGAVDYLCKPVKPEVLKSKVTAFVGMAKRTNDLQTRVDETAKDAEYTRRMNAELERRVLERTHRIQEAQDRLEQLNQELRKANELKDELLAMLGHELRNPLAALTNVSFLMDTGCIDEAKLSRYREVVRKQVARLRRLVDDLLDASRISQGRLELVRAPLDLRTVVAEAVDAARLLIDAHEHGVSVSVPDAPLMLDGDSDRLAQVVIELLENAAKFTPPGGEITLSLELAHTSSERADGPPYALLRVRDTGHGMPPELLPRAFDMFTQGSRTLDRPGGGLGVGLTLVKYLVELHGGTVEIHCVGPGEGCELQVRLPLTGSD